ncbi:LysR family transcriptional regulator [Leeia oryzae]|uniref:LysR family transcriptional regulator n=1 Tax=Leeia oryzae TaxID=356662 RepID=UPI000684D6D3|nr:LysR family transcriptional regulator [Leeia oryzae]
MDIRQIEYFVRVAELGSFSKAALVLDVAQSALSRQIRLLEVEARQTLLNRNGRGVTLTEAGQVLLEHGRGVLYQLQRTKEELDQVRGGLAGRVCIGLPPSLSRSMAVPLTRVFQQRLPEATLAICEGLSHTLQEQLRNGQMDLALMYNPSSATDIDVTMVCRQPLFLVQHKSHDQQQAPVSLESLSSIGLLMPTKPHAIRMIIESAMASRGLVPRIKMEVDSVPAILDLVVEEFGAAVLSELAVANYRQREKLRISPIGETGMFSLLTLGVCRHRPQTNTHRAAARILLEVLKEHIPFTHTELAASLE